MSSTVTNITVYTRDGSASKPALRQDTGNMVEKTYLDIEDNINIDIYNSRQCS